MALQRLDNVGSGYISDMTEDFCTYELMMFPISASGLQTFLDDGWEQMGNPTVTRDPASGHNVYNHNFRKIHHV